MWITFDVAGRGICAYTDCRCDCDGRSDRNPAADEHGDFDGDAVAHRDAYGHAPADCDIDAKRDTQPDEYTAPFACADL